MTITTVEASADVALVICVDLLLPCVRYDWQRSNLNLLAHSTCICYSNLACIRLHIRCDGHLRNLQYLNGSFEQLNRSISNRDQEDTIARPNKNQSKLILELTLSVRVFVFISFSMISLRNPWLSRTLASSINNLSSCRTIISLSS